MVGKVGMVETVDKVFTTTRSVVAHPGTSGSGPYLISIMLRDRLQPPNCAKSQLMYFFYIMTFN